MHHITDFGSYSHSVAEFADLDGFIPSPGEKQEEFNWKGGPWRDERGWGMFVGRADNAARFALRTKAAAEDPSLLEPGHTVHPRVLEGAHE